MPKYVVIKSNRVIRAHICEYAATAYELLKPVKAEGEELFLHVGPMPDPDKRPAKLRGRLSDHN